MGILKDDDRKEIGKIFDALENPVTLINVTQSFECETCHDTRELLEELSALSEKVRFEVIDFVKEKARVDALGVDKIPATVLVGDDDRGIRFYGIPVGYEFATLLEDIVMVSKRESGLSPASKEKLAAVTTPVHLEVLVTPT